MSDYLDRIAEIIDNEEMVIQAVSFTEDSVQFEYIDRTEQGTTVMIARIAVVAISNEDRMDFYEEVQNMSRMIIRDAMVSRREEQ